MAKHKRDNFGRAAIDWLKAQYLDGTQYEGGPAIRDAIAMAHTGAMTRVSIAMAVAWDRQARYELADDRAFVTQPIMRTRWARNPSASPTLRAKTQKVRLRELVKRVENQARIANAAAAQIDATRNEIRQATEIEVALRILSQVVADPVGVR